MVVDVQWTAVVTELAIIGASSSRTKIVIPTVLVSQKDV